MPFTLEDKSLKLKVWYENRAHFFLKKAVENEDKHSLEGVEYCEQVCHDNGSLTDEEEAEGPRETQQAQQGESSHDPRPKRCKTQTKKQKQRCSVNE